MPYTVGSTITATPDFVAGPPSVYTLSGANSNILAGNSAFSGVPIQQASGILDYYSTYVIPVSPALFNKITIGDPSDFQDHFPIRCKVSLGTTTGPGYLLSYNMRLFGYAQVSKVSTPLAAGFNYSDTLTVNGTNWDGLGHTLTAQVQFQAVDNGNGTVTMTLTASATFTGSGGATITGSNPYTQTLSLAALPAVSFPSPLSVSAGGIGGNIGASESLGSMPYVSTNLLPGFPGAAYSVTLATAGGAAPFTFSSTGSLPSGLALNASTGVIGGTPTTVGSYVFTVKITDTNGNNSSRSMSILICN